jgi:hypothetical protein
MVFEVTLHFFAPFPELALFQSHLFVGQVSGRSPGFFFVLVKKDRHHRNYSWATRSTLLGDEIN